MKLLLNDERVNIHIVNGEIIESDINRNNKISLHSPFLTACWNAHIETVKYLLAAREINLEVKIMKEKLHLMLQEKKGKRKKKEVGK